MRALAEWIHTQSEVACELPRTASESRELQHSNLKPICERRVECRAPILSAAGWQPELVEERLDPAWQFSDIAGVALLQEFPEGEEPVGIERERALAILLGCERAKVIADPILEPGAPDSLDTPGCQIDIFEQKDYLGEETNRP